jgi:hypothetical protein
MKLLVDFLFRSVLEAKWLPSPTDRANVVGAFTEVWKHLKGHRLAVYQNAEPGRHGLFIVVGILDTAAADKFLAQVKLLARLSGTEGLDLSGKDAQKEDIAEVQKLIQDLGSDEYQVRESATNRLALIGEPALPHIDKAARSDDPEVKRRALDLRARIADAAVSRRQELLSKDAPWRLRPTFAQAGTETHAGFTAEVLRVKLAAKDAPAAEALRHVFGPDWDRLRLVACGKQVVVLVGSDVRLLAAALQNVKEGKPGLAASKGLAGFTRQADPGRKMEFHGSVATVLELLKADDLRLGKRPEAPSLTSVGLTIRAERLQLDLWVPVAEIKAVAREQGW